MKEKSLRKLCAVSLSALMLAGIGGVHAVPLFGEGLSVSAAENTYGNLAYEVNEDGYRYVPEDKTDEASNNSTMYLHDLNQLGMGVPGNLENPPAIVNRGVTQLRERYNALNLELAPYAVSDPCFPFVSETAVAFGTQLNQIISDAAVQYIAGLIDEAGLQAAWEDWAAQGGDMMTEEYNAAYHAALAE